MNRHARHFVVCFVSLLTGLGLAGCGPDPGNARFAVRESVNQLHITHAQAGAELSVFDAQGMKVATGQADTLGSLIFRNIAAGSGYVVRVANSNPPEYSRQLGVKSVEGSAVPQDFYAGQKLQPGFNYIKTRDGTLLSAYVTLPGAVEDGPYPTVVDYSGYAPSKPGMAVEGAEIFCHDFPSLCDSPNDPSAALFSLFGYATVSVNMRGTGCSGGAYDYFETLQNLDGYDLIETVAAQDWVKFHKVGMVGLSYPGISQLFVASVRPPSLAAISPCSVIDNTATTLAPGGILNTGFAVAWVENVLKRADPYGQGWEQSRVDGGDMDCAENQLLHGQKVDNVAQAEHTPYYVPALIDPLNPSYFAPQINVPIFLAGAWQDEQTGPYFTTLFDRFTSAPFTRFTVYNGVHADGFTPQVVGGLLEFLDFFVAHKIPAVDPKFRAVERLLFQRIWNADLTLPADRFTAYTDYDKALAAYRAEPIVRTIFESGGGMDPGAPQGTFEQSFRKWPLAEIQPLRLYFHAGAAMSEGSLSDHTPTEPDAASSFLLDPDAGQRGSLSDSGNVDDKLPKYDYQPLRAGHAAAFLSDALPEDMPMLGTASADLYIRSTADDADLQVAITEVRGDGQEMYVQAGWLRASHRVLAADSTELWPSPTHLEKDAAPLPAGDWTQVRVLIPGFGHIFRKGSKIRISVDTPGGTRPRWRFRLKTFPDPSNVNHMVAHSAAHASSVNLPRLAPGTLSMSTPQPACPSLRGQPCRAYVPLANTPFFK